MKYLKQFTNESDYQTFKESGDYILPNVSYTVDTDKVFYNVLQSPYVMVDLGLPSGLLWADRNIGATSPEDNGLYFAWGDTVGYTAEQVTNGEKKFASDWSDYFDTDNDGRFKKYETIPILKPEDDAATVNMGLEYRMPTNSDFEELINNTTVKYIDIQGNEVSSLGSDNFGGIKFVSKTNTNSIFIPAGGSCSDFYNAGGNVGLWSSSLYLDVPMGAWKLYVYPWMTLGLENTVSRYTGVPVRGVCNK